MTCWCNSRKPTSVSDMQPFSFWSSRQRLKAILTFTLVSRSVTLFCIFASVMMSVELMSLFAFAVFLASVLLSVPSHSAPALFTWFPLSPRHQKSLPRGGPKLLWHVVKTSQLTTELTGLTSRHSSSSCGLLQETHKSQRNEADQLEWISQWRKTRMHFLH